MQHVPPKIPQMTLFSPSVAHVFAIHAHPATPVIPAAAAAAITSRPSSPQHTYGGAGVCGVWCEDSIRGRDFDWYITRFLLFFGEVPTAFCTYAMGSRDTLTTLPKGPRRLRILAQAGSSQKLHFPCAALRGSEPTSVLQGSCFPGRPQPSHFIRV